MPIQLHARSLLLGRTGFGHRRRASQWVLRVHSQPGMSPSAGIEVAEISAHNV